MTGWERPLVLASGSARRSEMLETVGIPIEVVPPDADESFPPGTPAADAVLMVARRKAAEVAGRMPGRSILAADTMVLIGGELLGKPSDPDDARRMLHLLSGREHDVLTGSVLIHQGHEHTSVATTTVGIADLTTGEIEQYVSGPEPYDKAGGYGIQAVAGWFVTAIRGSFSNVMGLPLDEVRLLLAEAGLPLPSLGSTATGR